jgi:hypothetical protein
LKQIDLDGKAEYSNVQSIKIDPSLKFSLYQNYPNPFNEETKISYIIQNSGTVSLKIFDLHGKELKTLVNKRHTPGKYSIIFDASKLPSGLYLYHLKSGYFSETRKFILTK